MKIIRQEGENECGISCLKMLLDYFHIFPGTGKIKKYSGYLISGTTMLGMKECLAHYHIEAKGYAASLSALYDDFHYPCILLTDREGYFHYVVLEKIRDHYFYVIDPAAGRRKMTLGELSSIYLGKALIVKDIGDNPDVSIRLFTYLIQYFTSHLKELLFSFWLTLLFTILSMGKDYLFYGLLDHYTNQGLYSLLIIMGMYLIIQKRYFRHLIRSSNQSKNDIVMKSYEALLKCRMQFFFSHTKEESLSRIESLEEFSTFLVRLSTEFFYSFFVVILSGGILYYFHIQLFLIYLSNNIFLLLITFLSTKILQVKQEKVLMEKSRLLGKIKRILYHLNAYRIALKDHFDPDAYFQESEKCDQVQSNITLFMEIVSFIFLILILISARKIALQGTWLFYSIIMISKGNEAMNTILEIVLNYPKMEVLYDRMQEAGAQKEGIVLSPKISRIILENVTYGYGYLPPIFRKINLEFTGHYLLQGTNGRGKSTLLKLIDGYDDHYSGKIMLNLTELKEIDMKTLNCKIVYVESEMTFDESGILTMVDEKWLAAVLKDYPTVFESIIKWNLFDLSAGKRQFAVFLYVLFLDFDVYLLDECFNHMDETFLAIATDLLESRWLSNKIVLCVEHNLKEIRNYQLIDLDVINK